MVVTRAGFAGGGMRHGYTIIYAAFPCPLRPPMRRSRGRRAGSFPAMKLLAIYIVLVVAGEAIAYAVGRTVETWSQSASLPAFLTCFFLVLWGAWRIATNVA